MASKPRILIIGSLPPPYIGPSVATAGLLDSAELKKSFDVLFCDISDQRSLTSLGKLDPVNVTLALYHIWKCCVIILLRWPDLVYFCLSQGIWGYLRDLGFFIPAVLLRRKVVVHLRGSEFDTFVLRLPSPLRWTTQFLFKRVACVIVLSERLRNIFRDLVPDSRIRVVPNGIDCSAFVEQPDEDDNRWALKRILWLSNLFERKGIIQFVQALPEVFTTHPDACVTVAGEWENADVRKKVLDLANQNALWPKIEFVGAVSGDRKLHLYKTHSLFVLTPVQPEGMPWAILEAMSAALPVISTREGAIPELVLEGKTGILVEPVPSLIAGAINRLLSEPERAKKMGMAARRHVMSNFSSNIYLKRLVEVFSWVAQEP